MIAQRDQQAHSMRTSKVIDHVALHGDAIRFPRFDTESRNLPGGPARYALSFPHARLLKETCSKRSCRNLRTGSESV